jgi:glycosidase
MQVQTKTKAQVSIKQVLPFRPMIYEINTWVWLHELSEKYKTPITLGSIPDAELDDIARIGADAVWFMGVWERSPAGIRIANQNKDILSDFYRTLPDYKPEDNVGSPYCVRQYRVDEHLGGPSELAVVRGKLMERGLNMILDFVPNHVAPDHPWVTEHPDYFISGTREDLQRAPHDYFEAGGKIIANGRDPYFPAWPDVAQLNPFNPNLRQAVIDTVRRIADQCDGIRCDMAMLLLNDIFARTWGSRAGPSPSTEYWVDVISAIHRDYADFKFIAEAYWDLEWTLQQQGFDYCYDKRLYDRIEHDNAESVLGHMHADLAYQNKLIRFIENHDEPRAAAVFSPEKEKAAAVVIATTPGAKLFHEGQFEGRHVRVPVFLGRRPDEPVDQSLQAFYSRLLQTVRNSQLLKGNWQLSPVDGWPNNLTYRNILAWNWQLNNQFMLIAVNLSDWKSQAHIHFPWANQEKSSWKLIDLLSDDVYERGGHDLNVNGLFVDLPAWNFHFLKFE